MCMCMRKGFSRRSVAAVLHLFFSSSDGMGKAASAVFQVSCQSFVHPKDHLLLFHNELLSELFTAEVINNVYSWLLDWAPSSPVDLGPGAHCK